MILYEVNLEVDDDINHKVAGWLPEHIEKVLKIDGFKSAYWFFREPQDEGIEETNKTLWTIQYVVDDRKALDNYFNNQAEAMRAEAIEKFGDKFKATRRILTLLSFANVGAPSETKSQ